MDLATSDRPHREFFGSLDISNVETWNGEREQRWMVMSGIDNRQ